MMLRAGEIDWMDNGFAAATGANGVLRGREFFSDFGAFHGEELAAFFDEGEAPFGEPVECGDRAGDGDVEGFAVVAVSEVFDALVGDGDVGERELIGCGA